MVGAFLRRQRCSSSSAASVQSSSSSSSSWIISSILALTTTTSSLQPVDSFTIGASSSFASGNSHIDWQHHRNHHHHSQPSQQYQQQLHHYFRRIARTTAARRTFASTTTWTRTTRAQTLSMSTTTSTTAASTTGGVIPGRPTWQQTMLRIKDPEKSLDFYCNKLGFTLIDTMDFPQYQFGLYFLTHLPPSSSYSLTPGTQASHDYLWTMEGTALELTHNYGTESQETFSYHPGNQDRDGFGHLAVR